MKKEDKWMRGIPYVGNKGQIAQKIIDECLLGNVFSTSSAAEVR